MKRRHFLRAAGLAAAASAIAKPAIAQSMPEPRWRLTSSFPKSLDTLYGAAEAFAKAVAEASDNKFPNPGLCRRRDCAGTPGRGCGAERHGRDVPHRLLLLFRQGPHLHVWHRGAVRPQ